MKIILVKKIKADGSPCRKCADVEQRLFDSGQMESIDEIVIADERDPQSLGMQLAEQYQVERAPFFLVEGDDGSKSIYTVYFQFVKEVLQRQNPPIENITWQDLPLRPATSMRGQGNVFK